MKSIGILTERLIVALKTVNIGQMTYGEMLQLKRITIRLPRFARKLDQVASGFGFRYKGRAYGIMFIVDAGSDKLS